MCREGPLALGYISERPQLFKTLFFRGGVAESYLAASNPLWRVVGLDFGDERFSKRIRIEYGVQCLPVHVRPNRDAF